MKCASFVSLLLSCISIASAGEEPSQGFCQQILKSAQTARCDFDLNTGPNKLDNPDDFPKRSEVGMLFADSGNSSPEVHAKYGGTLKVFLADPSKPLEASTKNHQMELDNGSSWSGFHRRENSHLFGLVAPREKLTNKYMGRAIVTSGEKLVTLGYDPGLDSMGGTIDFFSREKAHSPSSSELGAQVKLAPKAEDLPSYELSLGPVISSGKGHFPSPLPGQKHQAGCSSSYMGSRINSENCSFLKKNLIEGEGMDEGIDAAEACRQNSSGSKRKICKPLECSSSSRLRVNVDCDTGSIKAKVTSLAVPRISPERKPGAHLQSVLNASGKLPEANFQKITLMDLSIGKNLPQGFKTLLHRIQQMNSENEAYSLRHNKQYYLMNAVVDYLHKDQSQCKWVVRGKNVRLRNKVNNFCNDMEIWCMYWKSQTGIDFGNTNTEGVIQTFLPVFIFYVEMIITIMNRKNFEGQEEKLDFKQELEKARKFFHEFQDYLANPCSENGEFWQVKAKLILIALKHYQNNSVAILWHILELWIESNFKTIWQIFSQKNNTFNQWAKAFFNNAFFYGFDDLTHHLEETFSQSKDLQVLPEA